MHVYFRAPWTLKIRFILETSERLLPIETKMHGMYVPSKGLDVFIFDSNARQALWCPLSTTRWFKTAVSASEVLPVL